MKFVKNRIKKNQIWKSFTFFTIHCLLYSFAGNIEGFNIKKFLIRNK